MIRLLLRLTKQNYILKLQPSTSAKINVLFRSNLLPMKGKPNSAFKYPQSPTRIQFCQLQLRASVYQRYLRFVDDQTWVNPH
jgi:hypothetical protein